MQSFTTESELTKIALGSEAFHGALGYSSWAVWQERELSGLFGIPDLVLGFVKTHANGHRTIRTYAFEMKLANWKRALVQAYKYAAFAHYPFVVMDHKHVHRALRNIGMFHRSNVGLMSIDPSGAVYVHSRPRFRKPYCSGLKDMLGNRIVQELVPA